MLRTSGDLESPGGSEYNVACALARLGVSASWVSALPGDPSIIDQVALDSGVHLDVRRYEYEVGSYTVNQEAVTVEYNRANSAFAHLKPTDFDWRGLLTGARWLVMSGITPLLGDGPRSAWGGALTFAELDGTLIAMDLNHRPVLGTIEELWGIVRPRMRMFHVLVLSPDSLASIAEIEGISRPTSYEENIEALAELRRRFLIPHLCCTFKRPEGDGRQKRWSVVAHAFGMDSTEDDAVIHSPIENLGGGDAWLAGFIDALSEHGQGPVSPLIGALRGDLLASLCQNTRGDVSVVTREELDENESMREFVSGKNRWLEISDESIDESGIESTMNRLRDAGVIAILRGQNPDRMHHRGLALARMGCTAIEVTLDSPHALEVVTGLRQDLDANEVMIGVGTLLDVDMIGQCVDAGAEFALSPRNPDGMIAKCHAAGLLAVPGVASPGELDAALGEGARITKLFPSTDWSPEQLTGITSPWIPVGGVDETSIWRWMDAGAWCVGMGANLCGSDMDAGARYAGWDDVNEEYRARGIFMELQRRRNDA
jgi:Entner-Doudoroff aldolase